MIRQIVWDDFDISVAVERQIYRNQYQLEIIFYIEDTNDYYLRQQLAQ